MSTNNFYIATTASAFGIAVLILNFFPRSTFSERERRDLTNAPTFNFQNLKEGSYTDSVSKWYSDSEPFRDFFLTVSEQMKYYKGIHFADEIAIVNTGNSGNKNNFEALPNDFSDVSNNLDNDTVATASNSDSTTVGKNVATTTKDEDETENLTGENDIFAQNSSRIYLVGQVPNIRAMVRFTSTAAFINSLAEAANKYKETMPNVNVWVMAIPTQVEYYCPEQLKKQNQSQDAIIKKLYQKLNADVNAVDIVATLQQHVDEDIYLKTDHHWSPLGGYYAAGKFAELCGLPFKSLDEGYETRVVHGFVGTMYGYSNDIRVKKSPEDFVYFYPTQVDFQAHYITFIYDEEHKIIGNNKEREGNYFTSFKDGSNNTYCTFMGGDCKITRVETGTKNGRRLIILKDSFGNTLPSCLFYTFEEIHVIDYRYFNKNIVNYAENYNITDILMANNITCICNPATGRVYKRFLTQSGNITPQRKVDSTIVEKIDTATIAKPQEKDSTSEGLVKKH